MEKSEKPEKTEKTTKAENGQMAENIAVLKNELTKKGLQKTKETDIKKQDNNVYAVIMAGGVGSRFWPLSRRALPKQFIDLPNCDFNRQNSMLHQTAERILGVVPKNNILVATGKCYEGLVAEALPWLEPENLVVEEENLDTAFGMAEALQRIYNLLSLAEGQEDFGSAKVVFLPCDHYVEPKEAFCRDLAVALKLAEKDKLVTMGIVPDAPLSEYGYMTVEQKNIKQKNQSEKNNAEFFKGETIKAKSENKKTEHSKSQFAAAEKKDVSETAVWYEGESFVEKPRKKQAEELLERGGVFWNSGIFVGRAGVFAEVLHKALFGKYHKKTLTQNQDVLQKMLLPQQKILQIRRKMIDKKMKLSFDKLVMENLSEGEFFIVPTSFVWDDLGTFVALAKYWQEQDGNRVHGCEIAAEKSLGNIVYREGGLVALVDVDNLLVAEADGVLLIMPKDKSHHLKKTVHLLQDKNLTEYL